MMSSEKKHKFERRSKDHRVKRLNQYFESMGIQILSDLEFHEKQIKQTGLNKEFVKIPNYMNRLPQKGGNTTYNITEDECLRNSLYFN